MASKNNRASIFPRLARVLYGPVLALVSILLVLVVFETGLRFFGSSEEAPLIERLLSPDARLIDQLARLNFSRYDSELGLNKCSPGSHVYRDRKRVFHYQCNSLGFRGPEWRLNRKETILLLGDSQTFGLYLPYEKTIAFQLARLLNANILNSGIGGYGQREQLKVLKHYGPRYRPTIVVLFFFANDPDDNSRNENPYLVIRGFLIRREGIDGRPRNPMRIAPLLAEWESGNRGPLINHLRAELDRRRHSGAQLKTREPGNRFWKWARSQAESSRVLALFRRGYVSVKTRLKGIVKKRLRGQAYYWNAWTEEPSFRITINLLDKIREEIRRLSARLFLVAIPSPAELRQLENGDAYTMSSFIREYGKRRDIPTIILSDHFKGRDYCKYFGPEMKCDDKHLSELGARLTAEVVANFMRKRGYP